jgi:hypothetical protein
MNKLDHLLWACANLDDAVSQLQALSGATVHRGGSHPGGGTRNALLGLNNTTYLEIIGPDPEQDISGTHGELMASLPMPRLITYAVACADFNMTKTRLNAIGLTMAAPVAASRELEDGQLLHWQSASITGHDFGPFVPFLINWGDSPHPSASLAPECKLADFSLKHPNADGLNQVLTALQLDIRCETGSADMYASITTPAGDISLGST